MKFHTVNLHNEYPRILYHAICNFCINVKEYFICIHDYRDVNSGSRCYTFGAHGNFVCYRSHNPGDTVM